MKREKWANWTEEQCLLLAELKANNRGALKDKLVSGLHCEVADFEVQYEAYQYLFFPKNKFSILLKARSHPCVSIVSFSCDAGCSASRETPTTHKVSRF